MVGPGVVVEEQLRHGTLLVVGDLRDPAFGELTLRRLPEACPQLPPCVLADELVAEGEQLLPAASELALGLSSASMPNWAASSYWAVQLRLERWGRRSGRVCMPARWVRETSSTASLP
jgi:hypothetical protein